MGLDLNPIEHVWDRLNRSVRGCPVPPQTLQDLEQALIEEWNLIPQRDLRRQSLMEGSQLGRATKLLNMSRKPISIVIGLLTGFLP